MKGLRPVVYTAILFLSASHAGLAQDIGFPFGDITYRELEMKNYEHDSLAPAVVLREFGEAFISNDAPHNLVLRYHVVIKVFNKNGLEKANVSIPLWKQDGREELVRNIVAASYNVEEGTMRQVRVNPRSIFTENAGKRVDLKKFAIPNVREGTIIEYQYELESPFRYNFRQWVFQWDIPKIRSDYWALIPGNYVYNISLRGFYPLTVSMNYLVRNCFSPGGRSADCVQHKWAMEHIPAFVEEEYMTAKSNFISSINFELSEIRYFDGRVDKVTKAWRDAELELKKHADFGPQLRRGKDVLGKSTEPAAISDHLSRAKAIYTMVQNALQWNESYGMFAENGVKKAWGLKRGNVGDINLSLVAALREAGLDANPVILSTRNNGLPVDLYPVLSDFNYVVAQLTIGDKTYLLDATDKFLPFGLLPERCLNGKGRLIRDKGSEWVELIPGDKSRQVSVANLKLDDQGVMRGTIQTTYTGYDAASVRRQIASFHTEADYIADLDAHLPSATITGYELLDPAVIDVPLVRTLHVEIHAFDGLETENLLLNPNILKRWETNPFKSSQRMYPVDFGMPIDLTTIINIEMPEGFQLVGHPENAALALPNGGGRYYFEFRFDDNKLTASNALILNKNIYSSQEYRFLKALFATMLQKQNEDLVFKRKG